MSTYSQFETDPDLEQNGIVLDLGPSGKFKIARAGGANKRFARKFADVTKPYRRLIQTDRLDNETSVRLLRLAYNEGVLLGWEGVTGPDGKPLPFTKENAEQLFIDLPDLFAEIRRHAEDAAMFRKFIQEEDAKN